MIEARDEMILMWLKHEIGSQLDSNSLSDERAYLLSRAFDIITKQLKELSQWKQDIKVDLSSITQLCFTDI